jgi:hypothetical protein
LVSVCANFKGQKFSHNPLFEVYKSAHRDIIMNVTNKIQLYRLMYYSYSALHISGNVFARHQEHLTIRVFTVSGSVHTTCCRLAIASCW